MPDAAAINALLADLARAYAGLRAIDRRATLILRGDRPTAVKRRMLQALADDARLQRRRIDELQETLHTVAGPAVAANLRKAKGESDGPEQS